MSANIEFLASPVTYEEKFAEDEYKIVKFEVATAQGHFHRVSLPQYEGKRGVEGLFYCKDKFDRIARDYAFDAQDHFDHFPRILDPPTDRWWDSRLVTLNVEAPLRTQDQFDAIFRELVTTESGSLNPRDDLLSYLATEECKKARKEDVRTHVRRIETLCLYANRLEGVKAALTDDAITMVIFNSFPNIWLNEFRLARGNPVNAGRATIVEFFMTKKAVQDSTEEQNKKRKKEEKEKEKETKNKGKKGKSGGDTNMCRKHKTHPWSECSENPKSKNYYLNPRSPFYRGGRGGRGGGRGGYNNYGRGGGREQYSNHGRGGGRGNRGEQHHNDYRGGDNSDGGRDHFHNDQRGGGGWAPHDHHGGYDGHHHNSRTGWY